MLTNLHDAMLHEIGILRMAIQNASYDIERWQLEGKQATFAIFVGLIATLDTLDVNDEANLARVIDVVKSHLFLSRVMAHASDSQIWTHNTGAVEACQFVLNYVGDMAA